MQKKLIALAVAGLMSAPVMAQSNVQIYGIMDIGVRHLSGGEVSVPGAAKPKSRTGIDHSGSAISRLGFRGTEDLGNGLSAFFTIEQGLANDVSAEGGNRQAFVGLNGNFGRVWAGRDYNPSRSFVGSLDPFGLTGVARANDIFSLTDRYDNAIFYRTPNMGGFTVTAAYSTRVTGPEVTEFSGQRGDQNGKAWSITPVYKNGPLTLGMGYEDYVVENNGVTVGDADERTRWHVGGGYDFGVVDLSLAYGRTKTDFIGGGDQERDSWLVGAAVPVSEAGKILASYTRTKVDVSDGSDPKASKFALGYVHSLSKRTSLYGTYAKVNTNSAGEGRFGVLGTDTRFEDTADEYSYAHTTGFNVGIRHNF